MYLKIALIIMTMLFSVGCTINNQVTESSTNLMKFAYANCLLQYFSSKGYDTESIRNIAGGIVEVGEASPDTYSSIAQSIGNMNLDLTTKSNIDPELNKCFHLEENTTLVELMNRKN